MSYKKIASDAARRTGRGFPKINLPHFDEGGTVKGEEGEPQLIVAHGGEEVLNPKDADAYRAQQNTMKPLGAPQSTPSIGRIEPSTSEPTEQVIQPRMTKAEEKEQPTGGTVLAKQFLKHIGAPEPSTSDVTGPITERTSAGYSPIMLGQEEQHQTTAGGPLVSGGASETPREQRDLRNMERTAKVTDVEKQRQAALQSGDLIKADKLAVAKDELQKTPWSDRSTLGKIGKIASVAGNIAGDVLVPNVMAITPGTALNGALKERSAYGRILPDAEAEEKTAQAAKAQAETKAAGQPKPKEEEWSVVTDMVGPNGEAVQQEKNSGQMRFSPLQGVRTSKEQKDAAFDQQYLDAEAAYDKAQQTNDQAGMVAAQRTMSNIKAAKEQTATTPKADDFSAYYTKWLKDHPNAKDNSHNEALARREWQEAGQAPPQVLLMQPNAQGGLTAVAVKPGSRVSNEAAKPGEGAAHFHDPVVTYDPIKKQNVVMERGQVPAGQFAYKVDADRINTTVAGMNDVQNKINELAAVVNSSDMKDIQHGLVGDAIAEVNHDFEAGAFGIHVPTGRLNALLDAENMKSANQATRNFITAYFGAREAVTQLPRLQTFGKSNRMTEQQMKAAVKLLPGAEADPAFAKQKMESLQRMIDPLRKQLPVMPGADLLPSFLEEGQQSSTNSSGYSAKNPFAKGK